VRHGVAAQAVGDQDHWPGCRPHGGIRGGYPFLPVGVIPVALLDGFGPGVVPGPAGLPAVWAREPGRAGR